MDKELLNIIGLSTEELQAKVVQSIADQVIHARFVDEDGEEVLRSSDFKNEVDKLVSNRINLAVANIAARELLPRVDTYIEELTLQETNKWGEKTGRKITLIEYLVERANNYMKEEVNSDGKSKSECSDSYSWRSSKQPRVLWMIHRFFDIHIEAAMKNSLAMVTSALGQSLESVVKDKLKEVQEKIKLVVKM
jgi:hypothetical protein